MLQPVLTATFNLLLFRAGPQDFPYNPGLTGLLIPLAVLVNYLLLSLALPPVMCAVMALSLVMGNYFATRMLLRVRNLEARLMQTFHALLAVNIVTTLGLLLPFSEIAPELVKLAGNPDAIEAGTRIEVPAWASLMVNALNIWNFAVNAHIYRNAAGFGLGGGLLVALLIAIVVLLFVLFFAAFFGALFGPG